MPRTDRVHAVSRYKAIVASIVALLVVLTSQNFARSTLPANRGGDVASLIRAGHWKRARNILEPGVKSHPQDPNACYLLSEVKMTFGDLNEALLLAQHAVELDGRNSNFHLQLGKVYGVMADRASYFSAGPLAIKFRKQVETAIDLDPRNLDALDAMMLFKYQAPGIMGGSKDEAHSLVGKIAALDATQGFLSRAELAELDKDPKQMEDLYLKVVKANPKNYDAQASLAKYYSQSAQGKYDEAQKYAQVAIQIEPGRTQGHWILARVFAIQQRWGDLDQAVASAEKNIPDDLRPYYEAAQGLLEVGKDFQRAETYARKYLSQEPEGEEPDAADAHRLLGLVLEKAGRRSEALAEIQAALRLRPNFKPAKEDLKRLED